jgi:excisionase family DNA binding protein
MKELISVREACERLSIGKTKMFELLGKGEIESVRVGRKRLIVVSSLEKWIQNLPRS